MSLYGDLPAAAGTSAAPMRADNPYADLFGVPAAPVAAAIAAEAPRPQPALAVETVVAPAPPPPIRPVAKPVTLLFKPRQASKVVGVAVGSVTAVPSEPLKPAPSAAKEKLPVSAPLPPEISSYSVSVTSPPESDSRVSREEYNSNSSFEVSDAYDPRRPSDYMALCGEREEAKRISKLAEDNQKRMEELDRSRQEMERQRTEAAQAGDFQKLATVPTGSGRGRGRGLTNLPAWITQQMTADQLADPAPAPASAPFDSDRFLDAPEVGAKRKATAGRPSCVLLLHNITTEDEARSDPALADEIKEECRKYGAVRTCRVDVVEPFALPHLPHLSRLPHHLRARVFVHFERQDASIRAFKELNGRFFGGRQVSASFFDEQRFASEELAPRDDEF